jgi:PleD family two-component response regulator
MAERIRGAVAAIAFVPQGQPCALSVSIGGAPCTPGAQFNDIYSLADRHLYEAKHAGRDRVAIAHAA